VADTSKPAAAKRGDLGRDELLLAPAEAGSTRSINAFVKTDPSLEQPWQETEDSDNRRQLTPSSLAHRRPQTGNRLVVKLISVRPWHPIRK
jgi:hypothetical protein